MPADSNGKKRLLRGTKPRDRSIPADTSSYQAYIRSLTRKIDCLRRHLSDPQHFSDRSAFRRLERLIETRATALNNPPTTVDPTVINSLQEAIRVGN